MSLNAKLVDGKSGQTVKVTSRGQLVTSPLEFSTVVEHPLAVINTAYNFAVPRTRKQGVITDIILSGGKSIGTGGSLVEVYTANSPDSTDVIDSIFTTSLAKSTNIPLTGLNWTYPTGVWLNVKCDDSIVYASLAGYYIDV